MTQDASVQVAHDGSQGVSVDLAQLYPDLSHASRDKTLSSGLGQIVWLNSPSLMHVTDRYPRSYPD